MGCSGSKAKNGKSSSSNNLSNDAEALRDRIVEMLKLKQMELANSQKVTFSKILMKASTLNATYRRINDVYHSLDANGDGHLDDDELQLMIDRLGVSHEVSAADMKSIKELCDIDGDNTITIKEFIVTLTLLYLLKAVPSLITKARAMSPGARQRLRKRVPDPATMLTDDGDNGSTGTASPTTDGAGGANGGNASPTDDDGNPVFLGASNDIHYLVHWVVAAYLIFDENCDGHISRDKVHEMQAAKAEEDGSDLFLSEDRWRELDWDCNGAVSFEEFVFAFSEWIKDFNDEE